MNAPMSTLVVSAAPSLPELAYDCGVRNRRHVDLARAVRVARQVLSDLDPEEIPAGLSRVAAQTRPKLVPPHERRLRDVIDRNEWFRERVAEAFKESRDSEDPGDEASALFLLRPEGWEVRLEEIARRAADSERSDRLTQLTRRVEELESELDGWRNQAKRYRREWEADQAARRADRRAARRAREREQRESRTREVLGRENRSLVRELEAVKAELEEVRQRLGDARAELVKRRRVHRAPPPKPAPSAWGELDTVGAARLLDDVAKALSPEPSFADPVAAPLEHRIGLPDGLAPDHRSAIEWLLTVEHSLVLLVDGYNLGYHLDHARFNSPEIRGRLENDLVRLKALARGRLQVTVVYDSAQTGDVTSDSVAGGIEVRFTSAGHTADDELVRLAARLGRSAVVVSSDRQVREQAQESGSLGLWSEALAGWMLSW